MLTITVLGEEQFDEENDSFLYPNRFTLELEHSLVSLSKWEQKWKIPFLSDLPKHEKTTEMVIDYVRCMLLTPDPPADWSDQLSQQNVDDIQAYLGETPTAAWFNESQPESKSGEIITNELIYYWLTTAGIPWDPAQDWNLNRLFTLIKTFGVKNSKPKPMGRQEAAARRRALNRQRLKEMEGG
jgi:hypothetical protein